MANSKSAQDLLKGSLQKAGEANDGSSDYHSLALKYLNVAHRSILSGSNEWDVDVGEPWPWARARDSRTIILKAPYETGTITLTNGSTSGTFSTAPSSSLGSFQDRYLKVSDRADYIRITAHTAGASAFTIDHAYTEATGALNFKAIKVVYDLGEGILRLCEPMRVYKRMGFGEDDDGQIYGIDINNLRKNYPIHKIKEEVPQRFAKLFEDEDQTLIQFSGYPTEDTKVDFDVIEIPADLIDSDQSFPLIPLQFRDVLEYATAFLLCADKEDDKSQYLYKMTQTKLRAMLEASLKEVQHTTKQRGQLVPRADLASRRRNVFRGRF